MRSLIVVVAFALGALFTIGSIVAVRFEVQHFPPRPGQPRAWYLALLVAAAVLSAGGPFVLMRLLLPDAGRSLVVVGALAVVAVLALLGFAAQG